MLDSPLDFAMNTVFIGRISFYVAALAAVAAGLSLFFALGHVSGALAAFFVSAALSALLALVAWRTYLSKIKV